MWMSPVLFFWRPSEPAHYNSKSLVLLTAALQMTTHRLFWQCSWFHQLLDVHHTVLHWKHWLIYSTCCGYIEKSLIQQLIPWLIFIFSQSVISNMNAPRKTLSYTLLGVMHSECFEQVSAILLTLKCRIASGMWRMSWLGRDYIRLQTF